MQQPLQSCCFCQQSAVFCIYIVGKSPCRMYFLIFLEDLWALCSVVGYFQKSRTSGLERFFLCLFSMPLFVFFSNRKGGGNKNQLFPQNL